MAEATESATREGEAPAPSPLDAVHRRLGARMTERGGWSLPADYGDARAEYEAVRGAASAGLVDLSSRGRVEVSGSEAVQFLNGLVTNDVKALADGAWFLAALPNVQGRLLALTRVARLGQAFHIDTEPETRAVLLKTLERFVPAGDFRVRDVTCETACLSVQGAGAREVVGAALGAEAAGLARGRVGMAEVEGARLFALRATHTSEDGFDLFCAAGEAEKVWGAVARAGGRPVGFDALEVLRVEAGVARHGVDVDESNVVLEAVPDEAVSFTKGCYAGQEIIARIRWRGHVAKRLAGLLLEEACEPGAKLVDEGGGREAGRVTSCAHSPRLGGPVALGVVKYEFLKPGTGLRVAGANGETRAAQVTELPLVRGSWYEGGGEA